MLEIPERIDVTRRVQAYAASNIADLDPTVTRKRGFIGGFLRSLASALHDWYVSLKRYGDNEPFPQSASEPFFARGWWLDITRLPQRPAAAAEGRVVLTGVAGSIVPSGTLVTNTGGITYATTDDVTIVDQSLRGTSLLYSGRVARFQTSEAHFLATGQELTFSGSPYPVMDGLFEIRVVDAYTVEYDIEPASGSPVEANPIVSGAWTNASIVATTTGPDGNLDTGSTLTVLSPPVGVDETALVTFGGIADGADTEHIDTWRARVIEALGTDFGTFSAAEIAIVAKTVPGVTRVFVRKPVREPTDGYPLEGQVRIAVLRDNDVDPIPSALEVQQVKDALEPIIPAHTLSEDVEVLAPERYSLHVRFHFIKPDTPAMRASIRAAILQYIFEEATWGGVFEIEGLRCAIRSAFDSGTGVRLASYSLDSPTLDIALPVDAYPVLASITWHVGVTS